MVVADVWQQSYVHVQNILFVLVVCMYRYCDASGFKGGVGVTRQQ